MKSSLFIGVDVSQRTLDIAIQGQAQGTVISNRSSEIRAWLAQLPRHGCVGVESTGHYHQLLARLAIQAGHSLYVLNARDLSHYARSLGRRAKTDRLDAQLIARYLMREHQDLHPYQLPTPLQSQLDELLSRRHTSVVMQSALRQSFSAMTSKPRALMRAQRSIQALIEELDERMEQLINQDPQLALASRHLRSVVGFGPLLSGTLAHALTRHRFDNAEAFIAYIGYDPRVRDSGQHRGRRVLSKRGPAELRRLLYVAAMSASRTRLWQPFYERYRARGLATTAALVIVARKLARIAFSIVKYGTEFQPELVKSACVQP
jgi:transposase